MVKEGATLSYLIAVDHSFERRWTLQFSSSLVDNAPAYFENDTYSSFQLFAAETPWVQITKFDNDGYLVAEQVLEIPGFVVMKTHIEIDTVR